MDIKKLPLMAVYVEQPLVLSAKYTLKHKLQYLLYLLETLVMSPYVARAGWSIKPLLFPYYKFRDWDPNPIFASYIYQVNIIDWLHGYQTKKLVKSWKRKLGKNYVNSTVLFSPSIKNTFSLSGRCKILCLKVKKKITFLPI